MPRESLATLLEKLKSSPRVKGLFTTGSTASGLIPFSDIDLVVILDRNIEGLKAIYTMVEQHFSDIFFFDTDFLKKIVEMKEIPANGFEGMLVDWLLKGRIEYDPDGLLADLKKAGKMAKLVIPETERQEALMRINYNLIANQRYFFSTNPDYHNALELKLLYSIIELVTAYFTIRDIPWRGEKEAIAFLSERDPEYRDTLFACIRSTSLQEKMREYQNLFQKTVLQTDQIWSDDFVVAVPQDREGADMEALGQFWNGLVK